jgi:hypothetical protein
MLHAAIGLLVVRTYFSRCVLPVLVSPTSGNELHLRPTFCRFPAFGDRVPTVAGKTTATDTFPSRSKGPLPDREPA